jgi:hypothetical protein
LSGEACWSWCRVAAGGPVAAPASPGHQRRSVNLYDVDERHAATAEAVGGGSMFALSPGKGIAAHPDDVEAALSAYEAALFPRSESEYEDAYQILDLCLGERAPFGLIEFLVGALDREN